MKENIIYGSIFLIITVISIILFYFLYQSTYVKFDLNEIEVTVDNEYWTNGNVSVSVIYSGKIDVQEYSFDGGKTWQKENLYTAKENKKLQIVLKDTYGNESEYIYYRVGNIDKEIPTITVADKIYTAVNKDFNLEDYYVVKESVSTITNVTVENADKIDTKTIGEYEVDLTVVDSAGNTNSKTIVVAVVDKKDPNLPENKKGKIEVIGVSVDKTRVNLVKGTKAQVVALVKPVNATNKKVVWRSINTSVATVNGAGVITAVEAGSTTITVTTSDGNKVSEIDVVVTDQAIEVDSVTLDRKEDTFTTDDPNIVLTATVKPESATDTRITWSSSNLSVATIKDGVVTIRGEGDTTIAAATSNGKIATYHLKVRDNYVFQERTVERNGRETEYYVVIYKNGVDITTKVENISDPISVRKNRRDEFQLTSNQFHSLGNELTILYNGDKHKVKRAQS